MKSISRLIFFKLMGWRIIGEFPDLKKMIIIVVPHTSWHDFYIGLLVRSISGLSINFVGKKELFKPPLGWYFKWVGGEPLDRTGGQNMVSAIADIFNKKETFRLAIAPEGTRRKVKEWKTGFYYIALKAEVPVIMVAFDFGKKEVKISSPFYPTGDVEKDFDFMYAYFKGVEGKIKEYSF